MTDNFISGSLNVYVAERQVDSGLVQGSKLTSDLSKISEFTIRSESILGDVY